MGRSPARQRARQREPHVKAQGGEGSQHVPGTEKEPVRMRVGSGEERYKMTLEK